MDPASRSRSITAAFTLASAATAALVASFLYLCLATILSDPPIQISRAAEATSASVGDDLARPRKPDEGAPSPAHVLDADQPNVGAVSGPSIATTSSPFGATGPISGAGGSNFISQPSAAAAATAATNLRALRGPINEAREADNGGSQRIDAVEEKSTDTSAPGRPAPTLSETPDETATSPNEKQQGVPPRLQSMIAEARPQMAGGASKNVVPEPQSRIKRSTNSPAMTDFASEDVAKIDSNATGANPTLPEGDARVRSADDAPVQTPVRPKQNDVPVRGAAGKKDARKEALLEDRDSTNRSKDKNDKGAADVRGATSVGSTAPSASDGPLRSTLQRRCAVILKNSNEYDEELVSLCRAKVSAGPVKGVGVGPGLPAGGGLDTATVAALQETEQENRHSRRSCAFILGHPEYSRELIQLCELAHRH